MGRTKRDCPICPATDLLKLSNHLAAKHGKTPEERQPYLQSGAGVKRLYSEIEDDDTDTYDTDTENASGDDTIDSGTDEDSTEDEDNDNEEEQDPWFDIIDEVFEDHRDEMDEKYDELLKDMSKKKAARKVVKELSKPLTETLQKRFTSVLRKIHLWRKDPTYKKIKETAKHMQLEYDMDIDESLQQAVERRKVLLTRELNEYTPNFPSDTEADDSE